MITKYRPDLEGYVSTNQPGATGDGYAMAEAVGAQLIQMDQIQIHPTVEQSSSMLIAEGLRGGGAILVNSEGKRFFNEMSTRDKVSAAELEQPGKFAWEVFDQTVYDKNKAAANYDKSGLVKKGDSVEALAKEIEVDAATLQATIDAYNKLTTEGATDEFGRTQGMIEFQPGNMYAIKVAPGIHHEMGGIKINVDNQALGEGDEPIKGLYAAGEVTGGIHGNNRIGGNARLRHHGVWQECRRGCRKGHSRLTIRLTISIHPPFGGARICGPVFFASGWAVVPLAAVLWGRFIRKSFLPNRKAALLRSK